MNIIDNGDRVILNGSGVVFLRLKAAVTNVLHDEIKHISKGCFSIPIDKFHLVSSIIESFKVKIPDSLLSRTKSILTTFEMHIRAKNKIQEIIESFEYNTGDNFWNKILDPHQGLAVRCMTVPGLKGMCLFDEQGAGKTVMTISAFDILYSRGDVEALWVICPKSMMGEWSKEFSQFLGDKYTIALLEGDTSHKTSLIQRKTEVLISNFEGFQNHRMILNALALSRSTLLVVDESYFIKNPNTNRSDAISFLRNSCEVAFCLCGTPAPNKPQDIIHQFDIADGGYTFESFSLPENETEIIPQIIARIEERGVYLRRLKGELLPDLAEKSFEIHAVKLLGRQALLYEKAKKELVLYLRGLDNVRFKRELGTYFQKRSALLQICVDPSSIDQTYCETPAKFVELDRLIKSIVEERGKKVVLWSFYRCTLDKLQIRYGHYGLVRVDGSVGSVLLRRKAVTDFQTDPNVKIFIGNPAAAGAGITLHAASEAIYISYSNQSAHYLQSLDRIHRRGQLADTVKYHLLVCSGTIEENEILRLRAKERGQQQLLGDSIRWPDSLDNALAELRGSDE